MVVEWNLKKKDLIRETYKIRSNGIKMPEQKTYWVHCA
jgi:hypothetical protein